MALLHFLIGFFTSDVHAVVLNNAGTWSPNGGPNQGIISMWSTICSTLPFCNLGADAPVFFLAKFIRFIFSVIAGVGVCVIIYAGITLVTAPGSDEVWTEAKKIIAYALGGIVLAILGNAIVVYLTVTFLPQSFAP